MDFNHKQEHIDEEMILIQANVDDMNPEYCSYISEKLFANGANDVYWIPIIMKLGRPGIMINILVNKDKLEAMEQVVFSETTTLGLRWLQASCHRLGREFVKVDTPWGVVNVKAGFYKGKMVHYAPEFKECEEVARKHRIPLKTVYDEVKRRFNLFTNDPAE